MYRSSPLQSRCLEAIKPFEVAEMSKTESFVLLQGALGACIKELQFHAGAEFCLHEKGRRNATRKLLWVHSPYKQDPHLAYAQSNEKGPDHISGEFAEYPVWGATFLSFSINSAHSDAPHLWHSLNQNSQGTNTISFNRRIKDEH